jgi:ABC-type uncharacterized transport system fused permease/ATPase subunit
MKLLKIAIPSWKTKEVVLLIALTGMLVVRTYLSIWLADVNGQIVKSIVNRSLPDFLRRVRHICIFMHLPLIDILFNAVCHTFIYSKLSYGLLLEAPCYGCQGKTHKIFPQKILTKNVLLQSKTIKG